MIGSEAILPTELKLADGHSSAPLGVKRGVYPQGSILGPVLLTIYINTIDSVVESGQIHLYAYNTVLYCSAPTLAQACQSLQQSLNLLQATFINLRLVASLVSHTSVLYVSLSCHHAFSSLLFWSLLVCLVINDSVVILYICCPRAPL